MAFGMYIFNRTKELTSLWINGGVKNSFLSLKALSNVARSMNANVIIYIDISFPL